MTLPSQQQWQASMHTKHVWEGVLNLRARRSVMIPVPQVWHLVHRLVAEWHA